MHPKSYIETTDCCDLGGKLSRVKVRTGAIVKNSGIYSMGRARSKNSIFTFLGYPSTILCTAYRKRFYRKPIILILFSLQLFYRCALWNLAILATETNKCDLI